MGFDPFSNETVLDFSGTRYKGAEVRVRSDVTIEEYAGLISAEDGKAEWEWFQRHVLIGWNLKRGDEDIPLDAPRDKLPAPMVKQIINAWLRAFVDVDLPLAEPSPEPSAGR